MPGAGDWFSVLKMILIGAWILLCFLQITQSNESALTQTPARLRVDVGGSAAMNCNFKNLGRSQVFWYKELEDGRLMHIPVNVNWSSAAQIHGTPLEMKNVQRHDSGVYYCAQNPLINPNLSRGTKLFVSESEPTPSLSILVPSEEDSQMPEALVLLCVVSGVTDECGPVMWHIDSREFPGQTDAGAFDSQGVFSLRSLLVISGESWRQGKLCRCSTVNNSTGQIFHTTISMGSHKNYGHCGYVMYFGLTICLVLLLVQIILLIVCRERLMGRKRPRVRLEATETVYAATK